MTATSTIFRSQLSASEQAHSSAQYTGMMRSLADLAKAAYDLSHPGYSEYVNLNDHSAWSNEAWQAAHAAGWQPLSFAALPAVNDRGAIQYGMTSDGFFINQNAAALVMRSDDAVVIAFRGTNDYAAKSGTSNPYDPNDTYHPDKDDWTTMNEHYTLFAPLIRELDAWVAANNISKVYVTGHSMGGAMALEYMSRHSGSKYEAVTFAATPFSQPYLLFGTERKNYYDDSRITQIEVSRDTAPMMFDWVNLVGSTNNRPGQLISFGGNQTLDRPDQVYETFGFIDYWGRTANHSMDYYRQIVDSVSAEAWDVIRNDPGDTYVLLGGRNQGNSQTFVVDGLLSGSGNIYDSGADHFVNSDWEILFGGRGNDTLQGGSAASTLIGGIGNDQLLSGAGSEQLRGGDGNDTLSYQLASRGVQVSLAITTVQVTGHGSDQVIDVENLRGSDFADTLSGNAGDNLLSGGAGRDSLAGAEGNDSLDGGTGADWLYGGSGNDLYLVDDAADQVIESLNAGRDTVQSSISHQLAANIEVLLLTGMASLSGTGNQDANLLIGNAGDNLLIGLAGNDTLSGGDGIDTLIGGAGDDLYLADALDTLIESVADAGIDSVISATSFTLGAGLENLKLTSLSGFGSGNELANLLQAGAGNHSLSGGAGDDSLEGGAGADTLLGGSGNDLYRVDDSGDLVVETSSRDGIDRVESSISLTLANHVEHLLLTGTSNLQGIGNKLGNLLSGNAGNNLLSGLNGKDTLWGGLGQDTLSGGGSRDIFVFRSASESNADETGRDVILDFKSADRIDLSTMDADLLQEGRQSFGSLLASNQTFSAAGQLRFSAGLLEGNLDADADTEFSIELTGVTRLNLNQLLV